MSINPLSNVSNIWSRATTALTGAQDNDSAPSTSSPNSSPASSSGQSQSVSASTPFQKLASDLQSVLLQLQAGQGAQTASLGQAPTGATQQARPHHHHHTPATNQSSGNPLVASTAASGSAASSLLSAVA